LSANMEGSSKEQRGGGEGVVVGDKARVRGGDEGRVKREEGRRGGWWEGGVVRGKIGISAREEEG